MQILNHDSMGNKTASVTATIAIRFRDRDNTYRAPRNHPRPFKYFIPFRIENFNWGNSTTRFPTRGNFSVACHARLLSIFPLAFHFHPLSLLLLPSFFPFFSFFPLSVFFPPFFPFFFPSFFFFSIMRRGLKRRFVKIANLIKRYSNKET